MLSCKEVSHLNSQRFERSLTLREQYQLYLHLRVCEACTRVLAQFRFMHQALCRYPGAAPAKPEAPPG